MPNRKECKKAAKQVIKRHYLLFVLICLLAAFLGAEYKNGLNILNVQFPITEQVSPSQNITSINGLGENDVLLSVMTHMILGQEQKGQQLSDEAMIKNKTAKENSLLSHQAGVLSSIINVVTSGSFIVVIYQTIHTIFGSSDAAAIVLVLLSMLFLIFLYFFIKQTYVVISRRLFLEARTYDQVPTQRFLFLASLKRWCRTALTLFLVFFFEMLWLLTIVGFPIMVFSYYLVPYILAENPDIPPLEAIRLSRRMMKGHKWECFVFTLSFIGWDILDGFTSGLLGLFYLNAYKTASFCEYYISLRQFAKDMHLEGSEYLNDTYLFQKADQNILEEKYGDVLPYLDEPEPEITAPHRLQDFLTKWFGIIPFYSKKEKEYEQKKAHLLAIAGSKAAASLQAYPVRLSPTPPQRQRKNMDILYYARNYSIPSLILLFFSFSFIGWLWEVFFHLVTDGKFVNRGVLHGPWLPIYGSGALLMLLGLKKLREHPVATFGVAILLSGILEYGTSLVLEYLHDGQRWWDYTGYFLNIHGRVCAEGLLVFGIGGMATIYIVAPLADNLFRRARQQLLVPLCLVLVLLFTGDFIYSRTMPNVGEGITDYDLPESGDALQGNFQYKLQQKTTDRNIVSDSIPLFIF